MHILCHNTAINFHSSGQAPPHEFGPRSWRCEVNQRLGSTQTWPKAVEATKSSMQAPGVLLACLLLLAPQADALKGEPVALQSGAVVKGG
jgi:hypothetical protein